MSQKKKKNKTDKQLELMVRDTLTQNMIHSADEKFRELTEHAERSLTVFRRIPYQMIDMGDRFLFVEISGFCGDQPDDMDLNAVYNFDMPEHEMCAHKRHFSIDKCDIVSAEIGGEFSGYFDRLCGYLTVSYMNGSRLKKLTFYIIGENNQFAVKKFLGNTGVKINPSKCYPKGCKGRFLDKSEETVIGALVKFFNKKGRVINVINWILTAVSLLMVFCGIVFKCQHKQLIFGIAALLPLVIYLNYVRYNGILRLLWFGGTAKTVYHKSRAGCFIKMILPTICLFLESANNFGTMISFKNYFILGLIISFILMCLFDFCVSKKGVDYFKRVAICGMICLFYVFTSINHINRIYTSQISSEVLDFPSSFGYESKLGNYSSYYCKVLMTDEEYNFRISEEEYKRLENRELSARADMYSGILGLKYYDFSLVETSDEAKQHSDYIESLPMLPPSPTAEDMEEYNQKVQEALERMKQLLEKSNSLVSNTDTD